MNKVLPAATLRAVRSARGRSLDSLWKDAWAMLLFRLSLRGSVQAGAWIRLWGALVMENAGQIVIGAHVRLKGTVTPIELVTGPEGRLEIGERVFINYGCSISAQQRVVIGPDCSIGPYCNIIDNTYHRLEPERRNETPESQPVLLEENVWLGSRVIVLPGVTIGSGSAIGAGSVVTRDIPPRSVAAGAPARVIRSL